MNGEIYKDQVIEVNISADKKILNNFRNMTLPISIQPFFLKINGNESTVNLLPGSNAFRNKFIPDVTSEGARGINRLNGANGINGNSKEEGE